MRRHGFERPWYARWRRWAEELDPWCPRSSDYVVTAVVFLALALLYIGERHYAVELNRRAFGLEERIVSMQAQVDLLRVEALALGQQRRIVERAQKLGMIFPAPAQISYIYYVPSEQPTRASLLPRRSR